MERSKIISPNATRRHISHMPARPQYPLFGDTTRYFIELAADDMSKEKKDLIFLIIHMRRGRGRSREVGLSNVEERGI